MELMKNKVKEPIQYWFWYGIYKIAKKMRLFVLDGWVEPNGMHVWQARWRWQKRITPEIVQEYYDRHTCTGSWDNGSLQHDGDTCPVHEEGELNVDSERPGDVRSD